MKSTRKKNILYIRQKQCCFYCGNRFPIRILTFDHVVRRRDGGKSNIENLVLACTWCNHYREMDNASEKTRLKFLQRQREFLECGRWPIRPIPAEVIAALKAEDV